MENTLLNNLAKWAQERKYRNFSTREKEISFQASNTSQLAQIILTDYGTFMVHKTVDSLAVLIRESDCLSLEDALYEAERWLTYGELDPGLNPTSRYCSCKGEYGGCLKMSSCYFTNYISGKEKLN